MDRSIFLSSLPFLIPVQGSSSINNQQKQLLQQQEGKQRLVSISTKVQWPPLPIIQQPNIVNTSTGTSKVLLGTVDKYNHSFYLSIEFMDTAYSNNNDDDIVIDLEENNNTSTISNNNNDRNNNNNNNNKDNAKITTMDTCRSNSSSTAFFINNYTKSNNSNNVDNDDIDMTLIQFAITEQPVQLQQKQQAQQQQQQQQQYRQQRQQQQQQVRLESFSILYLLIQNNIFAIDVTKLVSCTIVPEVFIEPNTTEVNDNDNEHDFYSSHITVTSQMNRRRTIVQPPSLVLHFTNDIYFRIFSSRSNKKNNHANNNTTGSNIVIDHTNKRNAIEIKEEIETLQLLYNTISKVQEQYQQIQQYNDVSSSSSSTSASSLLMSCITSLSMSDKKDSATSTSSSNNSGSTDSTTINNNSSSTTPLIGGQQQQQQQQQLQQVRTSSDAASSPAPTILTNNLTSNLPPLVSIRNDEQNNNDNDNANVDDNKNKQYDPTTTCSSNRISIEMTTTIPLPPCLKRRKLYHDKLHTHLSILQDILDSTSSSKSSFEVMISMNDSHTAAATPQIQPQQQQQSNHANDNKYSKNSSNTSSTNDGDDDDDDDDDGLNESSLSYPNKTVISNLLNSIGILQNKSYCTNNELHIDASLYYKKLEQINHTKIQQTLNNFFPSHRAMYLLSTNVKKEQNNNNTNKNHNQQQHEQQQPDNTNNKNNSSTTTGTSSDNSELHSIQELGKLVATHKSIMKERYKLFLMPTRG